MADGKPGPGLPETLSPRQEEALDAIREYIRDNGLPPTVGELAEALEVSTTAVQQYLRYLERKGYIRRDGSKARNIRVLLDDPEQPATRSIPILGSIAAGVPIEAIEDRDGFLSINANLARGETVFALRVKGNSMIMDGILDGDYAVIRSQSAVDNGEIAVALVNDEATIKRFHRNLNGSITLKPGNPEFQSKTYAPGMVSVQGKVIAVVRSIG